MAKRNSHHSIISLSTLFAVGVPLVLVACVGDDEPAQVAAQVEPEDIIPELVPGDYPYLDGEDTVCAVWEADLGDRVGRWSEFYILDRMNEELSEEPAWREYYGRDEVQTCDEAREYQRLRLEYDVEHLPPTDPSIGGQYPEEENDKVGEPPGGVNNNANVNAVVHLKSDPNSSSLGCSGTLIHPRVILTAGHCWGSSSTNFNVAVRREESGTVLNWTSPLSGSFYRHPNYTGVGDPGDDVGLIVFDSAISGVTAGTDTMRVMTSSINVPDAITFYGWGVLNHSGTFGGVQRWGNASINWASYPYFVDNVFEGGARLCKGDSGGPATLDRDVEGVDYDMVGGMASEYEDGSDFCPYPGGYQRWSATNHKIAWIEDKLLDNGIDLTPGDGSATACPRYSNGGRDYMRCW